MLIVANVLMGLAKVLGALLDIMSFLVLIYCIISWTNAPSHNVVVQFINASTEPLLKPIRRVVPLLGGRVDLSPIVLFLVFIFLQYALVQTLVDQATKLRGSALISSLAP